MTELGMPPAQTPEAWAIGAGKLASGCSDVVLSQLITDDLDAGFDALVQAHQQTLYATAYRLTNHPQDAEDLTATCLLNAFRALVDYETGRLLTMCWRAWLLRILTNTWRNWLRTKSRRVTDTELREGHLSRPVADVGETPGHRVADRDELHELLAALPVRQREAVVLRHVLDLPIADVADIMGCPEGTVKSHISRGLAALRQTHPRTIAATTEEVSS